MQTSSAIMFTCTLIFGDWSKYDSLPNFEQHILVGFSELDIFWAYFNEAIRDILIIVEFKEHSSDM